MVVVNVQILPCTLAVILDSKSKRPFLAQRLAEAQGVQGSYRGYIGRFRDASPTVANQIEKNNQHQIDCGKANDIYIYTEKVTMGIRVSKSRVCILCFVVSSPQPQPVLLYVSVWSETAVL